MRIKYLTRETLLDAIREGEKIRVNQTVRRSAVQTLPDHLRFPVVFSMLHERCRSVEIRMMVAIGPDASRLQTCLVDVPIEFYNGLPEFVDDEVEAL
jgi:hypothetical protein